MLEQGMTRFGVERIASILVTNRIVFGIGLLGLCAAYLQSGIEKLFDFTTAVAETERLGLAPAIPIAVATIFTQLAASALILSGFYRWLGALWLAGFTFIVTFVVFRFWNFPQPDRFNIENTFFEHLSLVGSFILVAFYDLKSRTDRP